MNSIQLQTIEAEERDSDTKVNFIYTDENGTRNTLWFVISAQIKDLNLCANSFVLTFLLIAMKERVSIDCSTYPITKGFSKNLNSIQEKVIELFPELNLQKINIKATEKEAESTHKQKKASFFTGGVDSFFTLNKVKDLNEIIYVVGFDIRVTDNKLQELVLPKIEEVSHKNNLGLKIIATNLREITEQIFYWEYVYGMALGSVASLFKCYSKIYISSGLSFAYEFADGSHPKLDYLYSNEYTDIENFGLNNTRIEKLKTLMQHTDLAKKNLRVCWKNINNTYNCGVCEKCVRTKMELDVLGFLQDVTIFPNKKILPYLNSIVIRSKVKAHYYDEIRKTIGESGVRYLNTLKLKIKDFKETRIDEEAIVDVFPRKKKKNVLFIDFNGVISYNPFWITIKNVEHKLHKHFSNIEKFVFREDKELVIDWMSGALTTEQVHQILSEKLAIPPSEIDEIRELFIEECKNIDISEKILNKLDTLKKYYHIVLVTDNMDTFHRFTIPNNKQLLTVFDEIYDSYSRGKFKKHNDGELFLEICDRYDVPVEYATLIDDSVNNCACFSALGGRVYTPKGEGEVLQVLAKIEADTENKWEWQY